MKDVYSDTIYNAHMCANERFRIPLLDYQREGKHITELKAAENCTYLISGCLERL